MVPHNRALKEESATSPLRKEERATEMTEKGERRRGRERESNQIAPSSWLGTAKKALSRGCSFGQCLLFLSRSIPPHLLLSLALTPYSRSSPPIVFSRVLSISLFLTFPLATPPSRRSLSSLSPPPASTPVLHRAHETRVPAKSLCHLANARPRPGLFRAVRDREGSVRRAPNLVVVVAVVTVAVIVVVDAENRLARDPTARIDGNKRYPLVRTRSVLAAGERRGGRIEARRQKRRE